MPAGFQESALVIGKVLGHYRILEQIGAGGMGVVYRAWIKVDPKFDFVRDEPRFQSLLQRMNLAQ